MKKAANELRGILVGKEMSFTELDNKMMENGYWSIFNDGITDSIKSDKNIVYTANDTGECEVQLFFEITIDNSEDEIEEAFYLKVLRVEDF